MTELHKLAQAMCSIDLAESQWTQELPRLPVPDLWLTVSRYLASLKSVLAPANSLEQMLDRAQIVGCQLDRNQIQTNWRQFEQTNQLVKMFMLNEGPELQRDLKEYANKCQNWATEFWLQDMYLSNSLPLPVNSNPFFLFPRQQFVSSNEMLMFATRVIQFAVDFKYRIDQQALKQDFGSGHGKGKALCMETYKNFFHSYRMPHEDMDRLLPQSRRSNHIVVASCNQFYILRLGQDPLDNPYRKDASSQLNESSIFEQLLRIYRVSREHMRRQQLSDQKRQNSCSLSEATSNGLLNSNYTGDSSSSSSSASMVDNRACKVDTCRITKVGLFTTENRKQWAKMHKKLCHCNPTVMNPNDTIIGNTLSCNLNSRGHRASSGASSPNTNTESLRQIEDCLFVMCLDSLVKPKSKQSEQQQAEKSNSTLKSNQEPDHHQYDEAQAANIILTGGGSKLFTANRWFDKFLQIIVGRNGICGINIEHSASEGITVLRFLEEFLGFIEANPIRLDELPTSPGAKFAYSHQLALDSNNNNNNNNDNNIGSSKDFSSSMTSPSYIEPKSPSVLLEGSENITPLLWHLDAELETALCEAEQKVDQLIDNFSLFILNFKNFGRTYIKSQHLSPDAFIQLALQYTFYKLHGQLVSTYESASLRQFRLGRVDNIRANTCEAFQWIQAMLKCLENREKNPSDSEATNDQLFKEAEAPFIKAITKQVEILRYTIGGSAPDNHLLALRELAKFRYGDADELPDLFRDPSYKEFLNFRLSTSQLPNESGITVGYGAVVPDGYGCSYNPCEDKIVFCISSFADCPQTSSSKFAQKLEESLLEMQQLCLNQQKSGILTTGYATSITANVG